MERKIFELIAEEKNIINRFFTLLSILFDKNLRREYIKYRRVWKLLDVLPKYKPQRKLNLLFYPTFAFTLILLLIGIYLGKNTYKYDEYLTLTEEVMIFEE